MAIVCEHCGYAYNPDSAIRCSVCHEDLQPNAAVLPGVTGTTQVFSGAANFVQNTNPQAAVPAGSIGPDAQPPLHPRPATATATATVVPVRQGTQLSGRISHLERHDEAPSLNVYGIVSRFLIGFLILIPYAVLFIGTGILSLAFAIIGFAALSQLFNPIIWTTSLFELIELAILRRIRMTNTVPIYRGLVADTQGQEHSFRLRGPLRLGNLIVGHHVTLDGRWREGTFLGRSGFDHTASTSIASDFRNPWRVIFWIMACIYVGAGITVYLHYDQLVSQVMRLLR